jgi:phosphate transporter
MCILIDLCIWAVLLLIYRPDEQTAPPELYSNQHISDRKISGVQIYVLVITVITILLWCAESTIESLVGDMGVIAIIPIVFFYGAGVLTKDDWNSMLWSGTRY